MKFLPIHTDVLRSFGYTEEEARFLYLVATHSGYFTCQQFLQFIQTKPGKRSVAFAQKVIDRSFARAVSHDRNRRDIHRPTHRRDCGASLGTSGFLPGRDASERDVLGRRWFRHA